MARPLSQVARSKMLDAAVELALDVGVHRFTVDEVAQRSGVPRSTIYRHFPTASSLLVASLDRFISEPEVPDTGTLRGDLLEFLESIRPIFADRAIRALFLDVLSAASRDPELALLHESMMDRRSAASRAIFERGQARGEIVPDVDYLDAFYVFEAPLVMRGLGPPGSLDDIDLEMHVDRMVLVLGPPPLV